MSEIKRQCEQCMHFEHDPSHHMPEWFCALGNTEGPKYCQDYAPDIERERDEEAVAQMAALMRTKLAIKRREGRGGWWDENRCSVAFLAELLVGHLHKGDPVDVANFAMMLKHRNGGGEAMSAAIESAIARARREEREQLLSVMLHGVKGCSSHSCLIKRPEGMGTNGPCKCSENRTAMNILLSRIRALDERTEK